MTEAIIYCRVSDWKQAKGHGLTRQLDSCRKYAKEKGYHVVAVFTEICSAYKGQLPARRQCFLMAEKRGCRIIAEHPDRLSRNSDGFFLAMSENIEYSMLPPISFMS